MSQLFTAPVGSHSNVAQTVFSEAQVAVSQAFRLVIVQTMSSSGSTSTSRGPAPAAVSGGHVKINGERVTPGSRVKAGDRIELVRDRLAYSLEVLEIPPYESSNHAGTNRAVDRSSASPCWLRNMHRYDFDHRSQTRGRTVRHPRFAAARSRPKSRKEHRLRRPATTWRGPRAIIAPAQGAGARPLRGGSAWRR